MGFTRVHIEPEMGLEETTERQMMKKSLRQRVKDKKKARPMPKERDFNLFRSEEKLTEKMKNLNWQMDKYLDESIAPLMVKKERPDRDEVNKIKHTIVEDTMGEQEALKRKYKQMALNGQLEAIIDQKNREQQEQKERERLQREEEERVKKVKKEKEEEERLKKLKIEEEERLKKNKDEEERVKLLAEELKAEQKQKELKAEVKRKELENELKKELENEKQKMRNAEKARMLKLEKEQKEKEEELKRQKIQLQNEKKKIELLKQEMREQEIERRAREREMQREMQRKQDMMNREAKMKSEREMKDKEENERRREMEIKEREAERERDRQELEREEEEREVMTTTGKPQIMKKKKNNWLENKTNLETTVKESTEMFAELERFMSKKSETDKNESNINGFQPILIPVTEQELIMENVAREKHKKGLEDVEYENKLIFKRVGKNLALQKKKRRDRAEEEERKKRMNGHFDYEDEVKKVQLKNQITKEQEQIMQGNFGEHFNEQNKQRLVVLKPGVQRIDSSKKKHCDWNKKYVNKKLQLKSRTISAWSKSPLTKKAEQVDKYNIFLGQMDDDDDERTKETKQVMVSPREGKSINLNVLKPGLNRTTKSVTVRGNQKNSPNNKLDTLSEIKKLEKKLNFLRSKQKSVTGVPDKVVKPSLSRKKSASNLNSTKRNRFGLSITRKKEKIKSLVKPKIGGVYGIKPDRLPLYNKKSRNSYRSNRSGSEFDPEKLKTNLQSKYLLASY